MLMSMELWWNYIDWGTPKYSEENIFYLWFVHYESHVVCPD